MKPLTAIVLAAGVGSRLRPATDAVPKCLVPVARRPMLDWQLDALLRAAIGRVIVVAGYRASQVVGFCASYGEHVQVVENQDYATTNNMVSLRLAARHLDGGPLLLCNGDVVFDPAIARELAGAPDENLIAVEPGRYYEESMKVSVDSGGRITALSKTVPKADAFGVSIDVYRLSADGLGVILGLADRLIDGEGQANLWTEVAIHASLPTLVVRPFDIGASPWMEVDTLEDLERAELIFGGTKP